MPVRKSVVDAKSTCAAMVQTAALVSALHAERRYAEIVSFTVRDVTNVFVSGALNLGNANCVRRVSASFASKHVVYAPSRSALVPNFAFLAKAMSAAAVGAA